MKSQDINQLWDVVREASFAIHKYHKNGHLEKIYENALAIRLNKQGLKRLNMLLFVAQSS